MNSQCLIDTTNFINIKNYFKIFLSIFAFFSTKWRTFFFLPQIYFGITHYSWKKRIFFLIEFFMLWYTILCKKFGKICSKLCFIYLYLFSNCKPFCTIIIFLKVFNHTYPLLTHNGKIYIIYDWILLTIGHVSTNLSWRVKHCVSIYLKREKESSKASFHIRKKDILERPHSLASVNDTI